eukprot:1156287-Karenia_brevis.AAC.1
MLRVAWTFHDLVHTMRKRVIASWDLVHVGDTRFSPAFWDSDPIVCTPHDALSGRLASLRCELSTQDFVHSRFDEAGIMAPRLTSTYAFNPAPPPLLRSILSPP